MSQNSLKRAKEAEENEELQGTTNSTRSKLQEQPHTASKVEKSAVQAGELEHSAIVGNTNNSKSKAIPEEFREDTDATLTRTEKKQPDAQGLDIAHSDVNTERTEKERKDREEA